MPDRFQFCPEFCYSPVVMKMFTGRSGEIKQIVNSILGMKNIKIEGETRIGKTFLLKFLEDLSNKSIDEYHGHLIDEDIKHTAKELEKITSNICFIYISIHYLGSSDSVLSIIIEETYKVIDKESKYGYSHMMTPRLFITEFGKQILPLLKNKTIVIMLDEFETVNKFSDKKELLACLRAFTEISPQLKLIVSGWLGMEERMREVKEDHTSNFFDQFSEKMRLPPLAEQKAILLIQKISAGVFKQKIPEKLIEHTLLFTGCRPYYIQLYYSMLNNKINVLNRYTLKEYISTDSHQGELEKKILDDCQFIIRDVIRKDPVENRILYTICRNDGISEENLKNIIEEPDILDNLTKLLSNHLLIEQNGLYYLRCDLFKIWILKNVRNIFVDQEKTESVNLQSEQDFIDFIVGIIKQFKHSIEEKRGWKLLWNDDKDRYRPEEDSQILFNLLFEKSCGQQGVILHRETETGRGPVDFIFATNRWKAHIEMKRAISSSLKKGLKSQLPIYLKADEVKYGFYVIIVYTADETRKAENLQKEIPNIEEVNGVIIKLYIIDASKKESASKV